MFSSLVCTAFIDSSFCLVGLARETVFLFFSFPLLGTAGPGFFLLGVSGRTGRFFRPAVVPRPHFIEFCNLVFLFSCNLVFLDCILRFFDMACIFQSLRE